MLHGLKRREEEGRGWREGGRRVKEKEREGWREGGKEEEEAGGRRERVSYLSQILAAARRSDPKMTPSSFTPGFDLLRNEMATPGKNI